MRRVSQDLVPAPVASMTSAQSMFCNAGLFSTGSVGKSRLVLLQALESLFQYLQERKSALTNVHLAVSPTYVAGQS